MQETGKRETNSRIGREEAEKWWESREEADKGWLRHKGGRQVCFSTLVTQDYNEIVKTFKLEYISNFKRSKKKNKKNHSKYIYTAYKKKQSLCSTKIKAHDPIIFVYNLKCS